MNSGNKVAIDFELNRQDSIQEVSLRYQCMQAVGKWRT